MLQRGGHRKIGVLKAALAAFFFVYSVPVVICGCHVGKSEKPLELHKICYCLQECNVVKVGAYNNRM